MKGVIISFFFPIRLPFIFSRWTNDERTVSFSVFPSHIGSESPSLSPTSLQLTILPGRRRRSSFLSSLKFTLHIYTHKTLFTACQSFCNSQYTRKVCDTWLFSSFGCFLFAFVCCTHVDIKNLMTAKFFFLLATVSLYSLQFKWFSLRRETQLKSLNVAQHFHFPVFTREVSESIFLTVWKRDRPAKLCSQLFYSFFSLFFVRP